MPEERTPEEFWQYCEKRSDEDAWVAMQSRAYAADSTCSVRQRRQADKLRAVDDAMTMALIDSAEAFLARGAGFLASAEVEHGLIAGAAAESSQTPGARFALVEEEGRVVAAALRRPPNRVVVAANAARGAALAGSWPEESIPGVTGQLPGVDAFATRWCEARALEARTRHDLRLQALEVVAGVPTARGRFRPAMSDDVPFVAASLEAFAAQHGDRQLDPVGSARRAVDGGDLSVWEDGGVPVTLVQVAGRTARGIRVTMVYTPPELRGHGYATSCVAEVSRRQLASGRAHCMLFTDVHAPAPNRIYARIGYRPVADFRAVDFGAREAATR